MTSNRCVETMDERIKTNVSCDVPSAKKKVMSIYFWNPDTLVQLITKLKCFFFLTLTMIVKVEPNSNVISWLKFVCVMFPGLQAVFHGRCEDFLVLPAPVVTHTAPLPAIPYGPVSPLFSVFAQPIFWRAKALNDLTNRKIMKESVILVFINWCKINNTCVISESRVSYDLFISLHLQIGM